MEFSAPGVPSKGIPRARARIDCETGRGDVCGSRAWRSGRNSRKARATSRVEIACMAKERNVQRPTSNVQRSMKPCHPERSRGTPEWYLDGGTAGFLDFARNDLLIPSKFLISVFAGDWPD